MAPKKRIKLPPPITDDEKIEYVIYCRKSTDESSNKQVASIPRQITECLRFAEKESLSIAIKPKDFSAFESESEIFKEDNSEDLIDRKVYQDTRHLYIIKEQDSAKTPENRKKWTKLTKLIKEGKIRGLISYSPDRQARNILEGGELIDFVDQEILDLKYANFHFEPNASGKMMLGIWFVFSKQYSDKLSEDVSAANDRRYRKGETLGQLKYGYKRGDDKFWRRDDRNYEILSEAFQIKINDQWSDSKIAKHMNLRGFSYKWGGSQLKMTHQKLSKVWTDPFYYGVWIQTGKTPVELRDVDSGFEPMITKDQHDILSDRSRKTFMDRQKRDINQDDDLATIRVLENGFMKDKDGNNFCISLPNKKQRFFPQLEKLQKKNLKAILADVVGANQIRLYNNKTKQGVTFDQVDKVIREKLKFLRMTEDQYVAYLTYAKERLQGIFEDNDVIRQQHQLQINSIQSKKAKFETDNLNPANRDEEGEKLYQQRKKEYQDQIEFHENQIKKLNSDEEIEILNTQTMIKFMKNAHQYYDKCSYVQKARIVKILFLNIIYHHQNWLEIRINPDMEELFCRNGGRGRN